MPLIFQRFGRLPGFLLAAFFCLPLGQAAGLDEVYRAEIRPLLDQFCFECHADEDAEADIDLDSFRSVADIRRNTKVWLKVDDMLSSRQMPPKKADKPSDAQRDKLQNWVHAFLLEEARARAGDPGRVALRRLNNDEYNYSVRDLTGVASLNPTREFPIDGAAGEGFTNAGDALVMSPALVGKFLDAGKEVAQHAVLLPDGIRFSEHVTERDRADGLMDQIQNFYAKYVAVRSNAGDNWDDSAEAKANVINRNGSIPLEPYFAATLEERDALAKGGETLTAVAEARGLNANYLGKLWAMLTQANAPADSFLLNDIRKQWQATTDGNPKPIVDKIQQWQQALWRFDPIGHIGRANGPTAWMNPRNTAPSSETFKLESAPPEPQWSDALDDFRGLFPASICYPKIVPVDEVVTLSLYFREDHHLQRLMLGDTGRAELDRLWDELLYVTKEPLKVEVAYEQIVEFSTQDRPDLVIAWKPYREPLMKKVAAFRERLEADEPRQLDGVLEFAGRAWRRPLSGEDRESLRALYRRLREREIPHEKAIQLTIARVLTSPAFLYRREKAGEGAKPVAVSGAELATRLSYFLWSSLPDAALGQAAASGELASDDALLAQTRRMLRDPRTRRLAEQFACQWLHIRGFDQNDDKNEKLYPEFPELRGAMYEESVRFFEDMFRNDGSVLGLLNADHTFLNERLAKLYGIDGVTGAEWRRVGGVRAKGRGGVLGLATVLAVNSGASRTSPILRGNWVYETLLGERLPRPPANVPDLPDSVPEGLTARELIEQHSSAPGCAKCHKLIDPFGFALEQYDAIGRLRPKAVDTKTKLADGSGVEGIDGLRHHLATDRLDDVLAQFCRKLLGYALGREVALSDLLLIEEMQKRLKANDFRFSVAVEAIVTSEQFRNIRGRLAKDEG